MEPDQFESIAQSLAEIKASLAALVEQRAPKDWYTTVEVATILKKAPFTVRQWCRHGRVNARKRPCGRGLSEEWMISHEELLRIQNEGLLPPS